MSFDLTPAYILHTRPYRETSLLVDLFTQEVGRIRVVARGARRPNAKSRGLLQPFIQVVVSTYGKSDLQTLTHIEAFGAPLGLAGRHIVSGLYLNEVLQRVLPSYDAMPELFHAYDRCIKQLASSEQTELSLRQFEIFMLQELGYAIEFEADAHGRPIEPSACYQYSIEHGFVHAKEQGFLGRHLLAIATKDWDNPEILKTAKGITRHALAALMGNRPLKSRACYYREVKDGK